MNAERAVDELLARYDSPLANRRYDERVTQREHALQTAALAVADGASDALVAAALLHDLGHLLAADMRPPDVPLEADDRHEDVGARHLRTLFGPEVSAPVARHVAAKRYLCATDPAYLASLSAGSVRSLGVQGGPMSDREVARFRSRPGWEDAVTLRRWDDAAKVPGAPTPPLASHRLRLVSLLSR